MKFVKYSLEFNLLVLTDHIQRDRQLIVEYEPRDISIITIEKQHDYAENILSHHSFLF